MNILYGPVFFPLDRYILRGPYTLSSRRESLHRQLDLPTKTTIRKHEFLVHHYLPQKEPLAHNVVPSQSSSIPQARAQTRLRTIVTIAVILTGRAALSCLCCDISQRTDLWRGKLNFATMVLALLTGRFCCLNSGHRTSLCPSNLHGNALCTASLYHSKSVSYQAPTGGVVFAFYSYQAPTLLFLLACCYSHILVLLQA